MMNINNKNLFLSVSRFEKKIRVYISRWFHKKSNNPKRSKYKSEAQNFVVQVFSPGKTGTTSLKIDLNSFDFAGYEHIDIDKKKYETNLKNVIKSHKEFIPLASKNSKYTNIYFVQYREPISRAMSALKENFVDQLFANKNYKNREIYESHILASISHYHEWYNKFFKNFQIFDELGDIKHKKYQIVKIDNKNVVMFHLTENLNDVYFKSLNEFFGFDLPEEKLIHARRTKDNITFKKEFEEASQYKFSPQFVNSIYSNRYMKKFYTDHEILLFKKKYIK